MVDDFFRPPVRGRHPAPIDDARALINRLGDDAVVQAHFLTLLELEGISVDRPLGHWSAVEKEIARILIGGD